MRSGAIEESVALGKEMRILSMVAKVAILQVKDLGIEARVVHAREDHEVEWELIFPLQIYATALINIS